MKSILSLIAAIAILLLSYAPTFGQLSGKEKKLVQFIDQTNDEAVALLKQIVNMNSGTMNFEGVRAVGDVLMPLFEELGMEVR
jgi:glutamate carboxypeptidase